MANYLPNAQYAAALEAMFPSQAISRVSTANSGSTITLDVSDAAGIIVGMACTGPGITGILVSAVNLSTGVVTFASGAPTGGTYVFTLTISASLHTTTPGQTGAAEASGGSYARQNITFGLSSSGVKTSTNAQTWSNMPSATIGYFGFASSVAGSMSTYWLGGGQLGSSLTVPAGASVYAAIGAITATETG